MAHEIFDQTHDWQNRILGDRIVVFRPGEWIGPAALIGQLVPAALRAASIAVASDSSPQAWRCADMFARAATHGGFTTDGGFVWKKITTIAFGDGDRAFLLTQAAAAGTDAAAHVTSGPDGTVSVYLFDASGAAITEGGGLSALLARLATGRPAQPVNSHSVGVLDDRRIVTPAPDTGKREL